MENEQVYVVDEFLINPLVPKGISLDPKYARTAEILAERSGMFRDRESTEKVETQKIRCRQVIPYVVIHDNDSFFSYFRTSKSGEGRLIGNCSIGIGGHISEVDGFDTNIIYNAAKRELEEELEIDFVKTFKPLRKLDMVPIGTIYDDSDPVNSVHLGIIYFLTSQFVKIEGKEDHLEKCEWRKLEELKELELESWSKMILDSPGFQNLLHKKQKLYVG